MSGRFPWVGTYAGVSMDWANEDSAFALGLNPELTGDIGPSDTLGRLGGTEEMWAGEEELIGLAKGGPERDSSSVTASRTEDGLVTSS